ncbi:hypothetical protein EPJ79_02595 [Brachyspira aalborgi]|uniref:Lipoprotein n=1 Tax=Brachyspira aalborgi TaxID=29522 RepID=A0A5C8D4Y6_9SPIR|nr:hypothetical protein [Brachyspira aalborgi]TXJ20063.1 hypothetical protein EPJ79_02595 [Brachyspira aalborgi]
MKLKICIIIFYCLLILACKSVKEPDYIELIGELTPGGRGRLTLEVFVYKRVENMIFIIYIFLIPME